MSDGNMNDTQPNQSIRDTQPGSVRNTGSRPSGNPGARMFPRWLVIVVIVFLVVLGVLSGYGSGLGLRQSAQKTQVAGQLQEQFALAVEMMEAGQYDKAKSHFDFIIKNDPGFPGVMEAYAELLIRMQTSPTPTLTSSPTPTATPDLRGAEAIYASARQALSARDWDLTLTHLDSLRKNDPAYKTAEVDGMYYLALRMRGVDKILLQEGEVCADVNLEGGIYDLTLAERFGTLDAIAESLRTYSRLYIIGASYWDQDWVQAQMFFDQVRSGNPNLRDASCVTATERWRYATIKRAVQLLEAGDYCGAEEQFNLAFSVASDKNLDYYPTATENSILCDGGEDGGGDDETPTPPPWWHTETPTEITIVP